MKRTLLCPHREVVDRGTPVARARKHVGSPEGWASLPRLAAVAGCLLLLGLTGCESFASRGMNAEGVRLFQQANYQAALSQFQQAVYTDPTNADGYYNLAATYHRLGKMNNRKTELDQAESLYNQCLDRDRNHSDCYRGLAVLLVEQNRNDEAFRLVEGWVDRTPTSADARIELARLFEEFGDKRAARERLAEALHVDPNNSRALTAMGKLWEEMGEPQKALVDYQRSLWLNHFQPEVQSRVAALQTMTPTPVVAALPDSTVQTVGRNPTPRR